MRRVGVQLCGNQLQCLSQASTDEHRLVGIFTFNGSHTGAFAGGPSDASSAQSVVCGTPKTWISGKVETNTGALVEDLVVARRLNQSSCMRHEASIDEHRLDCCDESWHMSAHMYMA